MIEMLGFITKLTQAFGISGQKGADDGGMGSKGFSVGSGSNCGKACCSIAVLVLIFAFLMIAYFLFMTFFGESESTQAPQQQNTEQSTNSLGCALEGCHYPESD